MYFSIFLLSFSHFLEKVHVASRASQGVPHTKTDFLAAVCEPASYNTSKLGTTNTTAPKGYYLVMPAISDIEIVYNK